MADESVDAEAQQYRRLRENVKSEFCKFAEHLGDDALSGKAVAMTTVVMDAEGNLTAVYLGIRPTEAIGMLEIGKEILKSGLLSNRGSLRSGR